MKALSAPAPTRFVFVDHQTWQEYNRDRDRIVREWPCAPEDRELWDVHATMRIAAVLNLREQVLRALEMGCAGGYPVPV